MLGWAGQKEVSGSEDPFQQEAEGQKSEKSMQLEEGLRIRCGSHEHSVLNTRICFGISQSLNWGKNGTLWGVSQTVKSNCQMKCRQSINFGFFLLCYQSQPSHIFHWSFGDLLWGECWGDTGQEGPLFTLFTEVINNSAIKHCSSATERLHIQ